MLLRVRLQSCSSLSLSSLTWRELCSLNGEFYLGLWETLILFLLSELWIILLWVVQSKNERRVVLYVIERGASQLSRKERALLLKMNMPLRERRLVLGRSCDDRCLFDKKNSPHLYWRESRHMRFFLDVRLSMYEHLNIFCCVCFAHVPSATRDKLSPKATRSIFFAQRA